MSKLFLGVIEWLDMVLADRRSFLRTIGVGAVVGSSGCVAPIRELVGPIRKHVHRKDAPVDDISGPWPMLGAAARRDGAISDISPPPSNAYLRRVTSIGLYPQSQPAIVNGRVYIGVDRRTTERDDSEFTGLLAIDLDAERRDETVVWKAKEGGSSTSFTPAARGRVVFAPIGEGITALDARDGSAYWRNAAGGLTPAIDGEYCLTANGDGVIALDAVTGKKRWTSESTVAAPAGLAVDDDAIALACGDGGQGALYCFERSTGLTRWRYDAIGESYATPVVDGERVYAVGTDGVIHAVELENGKPAWTYPTSDPSYARPSVLGGTIYVAGTNSDSIAALDAASGESLWERQIGVGGVSPPAVTTDALFFTTATRDGERLFVLDSADGSERQRYKVPENDPSSVQPVIDDGIVFLVAESSDRAQGSLYVLQ